MLSSIFKLKCKREKADGKIQPQVAWGNRSVLGVHEDFEHRATQQSGRVAAFKTRSERSGCRR